MKLLYLLPAEGFGGAERQGVLHIQQLPRYGCDVVAVVGPGAPVCRALECAGVSDSLRVSCFPDHTHAKMSPVDNLRYFVAWCDAFRRSVDAVHRLARPLGVDVIFANRTFAWPVGAAVASRLGIPYVLRAGSRPTNALAPSLLRLMCARWGRPRAVLSNCAAVSDVIAPHLGCASYLLPNAIDTERFRPRSVTPNRAEGSVVVGMAARPAPDKGIELLMRVVKLVTARRPDVVLEVAGDFGWRPHFEAEVRRAGLSRHLRFVGHLDDVASFYERCEVVVLTSRQRSIEGSPNALLEAMAMQRPVVATRVGGVPELVRDGVEGYLVAPEPEPFAERLLSLLGDPERRAAMGAAGRARVVDRHAIPRVMTKLTVILREVLGGSAVPSRAIEIVRASS